MDHDRSTLSPGIPNGARMASEGMTMAAARPDPEIAAVARRRRGSAGEKRVLMVAASPPGEVANKGLRSIRSVSPARPLRAARQPEDDSVSSQTPSQRLATCRLVQSCSGATPVRTARCQSRSEAHEAVS